MQKINGRGWLGLGLYWGWYHASFPGHTQLHADWVWPENEATKYHNFRNEDFRNSYINAGQRGFGNRYFRNRYRLDKNTLVLTFDP